MPKMPKLPNMPKMPTMPKSPKKLLIILACALLATACHRPYDTVFSTYPNGSPKLVFTVIDGKGSEMIRVGEKMYYENGNIMYEKHFKDDKPTGEWRYCYDNGQIHTSGNFLSGDSNGTGWKFYDRNGKEFVTDYDSMHVLQYTSDHRPLSVTYYTGDTETRYQFNNNYTINAHGIVRNGMKEGLWEFFYANGQKMLEAHYIENVENGLYISYRENGVPYFRGVYINGKRANVWEFYDEEGNLAGTKNFDD